MPLRSLGSHILTILKLDKIHTIIEIMNKKNCVNRTFALQLTLIKKTLHMMFARLNR